MAKVICTRFFRTANRISGRKNCSLQTFTLLVIPLFATPRAIAQSTVPAMDKNPPLPTIIETKSGSVAQAAPVTLQPMAVFGCAPSLTTITQDAEAAPASVTIINKKELGRLTINTYGDILRNRASPSVSPRVRAHSSCRSRCNPAFSRGYGI